ncbi:MAG: rhodanese-like domain-containing protein [Chloroflexota bacterium]
MAPEITVKDLALKLQSQDEFVLLDVREAYELEAASLSDRRLVTAPMSRLSREGISGLPPAALDRQAVIYVLCHHGVRSAQVTNWLSAQGWKNVFSVRGGIDAYAAKVDRAVGFY